MFRIIKIIFNKYFTTAVPVTTNEPQPHWDAELYKKNSILLQQTTAKELIATLHFQSNDRLLDVGCGDGKITAELATLVPNGFVEGTDLSTDMITLAKKEHGSIKNIAFSVMDAQNLSFSKPFDAIVSFFCLQWVPNKQQSYIKMANLLKPGGQVAFIMTDRNPYLLQVRQKLYNHSTWSEYFVDYKDATDVIDDDKYPEYAKNAGFTNIRYSEKPKTLFFSTREELKVFIQMVTPAAKRVSLAKQNVFIEQLVEGYLKIVPEVDGSKHNMTYMIKTLTAGR